MHIILLIDMYQFVVEQKLEYYLKYGNLLINSLLINM